MSEYQSYAFQAIDRRLTDKEMAELRSVSSRGRITPTSFTNEYSWGDFKGSPDVWMEKYFDAFLYLGNWGTHIFKLRLPARLLDLSTARLYCVGDSASAREKNGNVIFHFGSDGEGEGGWIEEDEDSEQLGSLIPVRSDLARGDLRVLYLGWLRARNAASSVTTRSSRRCRPALHSLTVRWRASPISCASTGI